MRCAAAQELSTTFSVPRELVEPPWFGSPCRLEQGRTRQIALRRAMLAVKRSPARSNQVRTPSSRRQTKKTRSRSEVRGATFNFQIAAVLASPSIARRRRRNWAGRQARFPNRLTLSDITIYLEQSALLRLATLRALDVAPCGHGAFAIENRERRIAATFAGFAFKQRTATESHLRRSKHQRAVQGKWGSRRQQSVRLRPRRASRRAFPAPKRRLRGNQARRGSWNSP